MSTVATGVRFERAPGCLCRDTGVHVLVLPPGSGGEVTVLGGGGATVWRLLGEPAALADLQISFDGLGQAQPAAEELAACVEDLVQRKLLVHCDTGDSS